jgi:predicted O-methyltransferase YrrM
MSNSVELSKSWGLLSLGEVEAMRSVVLSLPENSVCINIGAGVGTSGMIFMECKNVAKFYTVDIFRGTRGLGGLGNESGTFRMAGVEDLERHHQICGDAAEVGKVWNGGMVDMVFIDGDHSYEHCSADTLAWLPHIKSGGVLAYHDYIEDPWITVWRCVNDLALPNYEVIARERLFVAFRIT